MKYPNAKHERNEQIINYRKEHPEMSLDEIGDAFGITRQRVSAILKRKVRRNGNKGR